MNLDFASLLVLITLISGFVSLVDWLFFQKKREAAQLKMPWLIEQCRSLFPVFLLVLIMRSFLFEPYRIPSGSLKPTLLDGDFIIVNKFDYGLRLPISNTEFFSIGQPERGDIMVFHWPADPKYDFIKRVIGLPGDHIRYIHKTLYINGKKIPQTFSRFAEDSNIQHQSWPVDCLEEDLLGVKHKIYINTDQPAYDLSDLVVPPHMYFVMGDNRDNSQDSRYWGFVPEKNIVGKAIRIVLSWDGNDHRFRWSRFGSKIQ